MSINPNNHYAHNKLAVVYRELNNFEKSIEELRMAADLKNNKDAWHDWLDIGRSYEAIKKNSEAIVSFNKALSILESHKNEFESETFIKNTGGIYYWLGRIYCDDNKLSVAEEFTLKALEARPNDYYSHFYLAKIYYKQKNLSSAEKYIKRAYELADNDMEKETCLLIIFYLLYDQGKYDESKRHLKDIIRMALRE